MPIEQTMNPGIPRGKKILVIDDDPDTALLLQRELQKSAYQVVVAGTGSAGRERIESWQPDLVLLDVFLPDMTGVQLLQALRDEHKHNLPFIIMSADDSEETSTSALIAGAFDFINKPLRFADLKLKIEHALELLYYKTVLEETNQKLEAEKRRLMRYFPDQIVSRILNEEIAAKPGGVIQNATILFLDLRNSTGLAEEIGAHAFAGVLNLLFTDFMDLIFRYGGSVNKLLGDGILATFGCPEESPDDARNCVRCALDIRRTIATLNDLEPDFLPGPIQLGMGIASGKVFAGNVGSLRRMEYTVLGDPVNIAARLQSVTKKLETDILLDEETARRVSDEFILQKAGMTRLRGKSHELAVFIPLSRKEATVPATVPGQQ